MEMIPETGEDPAEDVAYNQGHHQQHNRSTPSEWENIPSTLHHVQRHHPVYKWLSNANPNKD